MANQLNLLKNIPMLLKANEQLRCFSLTAAQWKQKKKPQPPAKVRRIEDMGKSLSAKGFLRSIKAYTAPPDAAERVKSICKSLQTPSMDSYTLGSTEEKFKLLEACFREFKHSVPNSRVHEINTLADVIEFYQTDVDTTVPFDALKKIDLPENLHIQYEYIRFHPETDTKFNGQTAFPKSSTLVTGLKYRKKYQGHDAKRSWP